jgi:hypothetical protein
MALVLWLGKALNLPTRVGLGLIVYLSVQVFLGRLNLRIFQQETLQK